MKTLLFNGCSFVAGDALVWDKYCQEVLKFSVDWKGSEHGGKHREDYIRYRSHYTLSAQCASLCNTTSLDLSADGASNAHIALTTLNYLMGLSAPDRKNIHVCIGWTEESRRLRWHDDRKIFVGLNVHSAAKPGLENLQSFIIADVINGSPADHDLDFFKHVLLLENFLLRYNISYTFWRSLGDIINPHKGFKKILNVDDISDNNWVKFDISSNQPAFLDQLWFRYMTADDYINKSNQHPNVGCVATLATTLSNMILI